MKLYYPILLSSIMPICGFVCSPKKNNDCIRGQIIRITCASTVVRITSTDSLGEDQWKDVMDSSGSRYDNVFKMANKCDLPSISKVGDIVSFRLTAPKVDSCMVCMMYDAPPSASYSIDFCQEQFSGKP